RGSADHNISDVDALRVTSERLNSAGFGLGEQRHIFQTVFLQDGLHGRRAAAESKGVDGQDGYFGIHMVALVTGEFILALHGLAEDHPKRVASRNTVASGQHELVAEGMLRAANIPAQAAERWTGKMDGHIVRRISK